MKKLIFLCFWLLLAQGLAAQQLNNPKYLDYLHNAPLVFEGEIVHMEHYSPKSYLETVQEFVKVCRVYRGDQSLVGKTVEILYPARLRASILQEGARKVYTDFKNSGSYSKCFALYFAEANTYDNVPFSPNFQPDVKQRLQLYKKEMESLPLNCENGHCDPYERRYQMLKDFKKIAPDLRIEDKECLARDVSVKKSKNLLAQKRFDDYFEQLKKTVKTLNNTNRLKSGSTPIVFTIEASGLSSMEDGTDYYTIAILVSSNLPRYLENALLRIKYNAPNDDVFYPNSVSSDKVEVRLIGEFDKPTYLAPYLSDATDDTFTIGIRTDHSLSKMDRTLITSTPQNLLLITFEMKPEPISSAGSENDSEFTIRFTDTNFTSGFNFYTLHADDAVSGEAYPSSSESQHPTGSSFFYYE